MMLNGTIVSAYVADRQGISAAISKMAFGSGLGVELNDDVSYANLFAPSYADFVFCNRHPAHFVELNTFK